MYTLKVQSIECADGLDMCVGGKKADESGMTPRFSPKQSKGQEFPLIQWRHQEERLEK